MIENNHRSRFLFQIFSLLLLFIFLKIEKLLVRHIFQIECCPFNVKYDATEMRLSTQDALILLLSTDFNFFFFLLLSLLQLAAFVSFVWPMFAWTTREWHTFVLIQTKIKLHEWFVIWGDQMGGYFCSFNEIQSNEFFSLLCDERMFVCLRSRTRAISTDKTFSSNAKQSIETKQRKTIKYSIIPILDE